MTGKQKYGDIYMYYYFYTLGGRIRASLKCPYSNPQNLAICQLKGKGELTLQMELHLPISRIYKREIILDCRDRPNIVRKVPKNMRDEKESELGRCDL